MRRMQSEGSLWHLPAVLSLLLSVLYVGDNFPQMWHVVCLSLALCLLVGAAGPAAGSRDSDAQGTLIGESWEGCWGSGPPAPQGRHADLSKSFQVSKERRPPSLRQEKRLLWRLPSPIEATSGESVPTTWWCRPLPGGAGADRVPQVVRAVLHCPPAPGLIPPGLSPPKIMPCRMLAVHTDGGSLVQVQSSELHSLLKGIRTGQRVRIRGRWAPAAPGAASTDSGIRAAAAAADQAQAGFQAERVETLDAGPAITRPTIAIAAMPSSGGGGAVSAAAAAGDRIVLVSNKMPSTSRDITTLVIPSERGDRGVGGGRGHLGGTGAVLCRPLQHGFGAVGDPPAAAGRLWRHGS